MTGDRILVGRGSEAPVELAFKNWLVANGWRLIDDSGSGADVIAERGDERLIGEVKGHTGEGALTVRRLPAQLTHIGGDVVRA